jgi:two-component system, OmpR family, response regulator
VALRTFIVEDNPDAFATLSEYLAQAAGTETAGWATGERQARTFLERNPAAWDLAIVDLFLTEGSGLGVLRACRERRAQQKVVVLSNYSTPEMRSRCEQLGANAVFDKVTDFAALVEFCKEAGDEVAGR